MPIKLDENPCSRVDHEEKNQKAPAFSNNLLVKNNLLTNIERYKHYDVGILTNSPALSLAIELGKIDSFLRNDLLSIIRDAYGRKPWEEYVACSNPDCDNQWGIEQAMSNHQWPNNNLDQFEQVLAFNPANLNCNC